MANKPARIIDRPSIACRNCGILPCLRKDNHVDAELYVTETNSRTILSLKT